MTIRSDIYAATIEYVRLGTGPDGQPWLQWTETDALYCLTHRPDVAEFTAVMTSIYRLAHPTLIPDRRDTKAVLDMLAMEARTSGALSAVTETEARARGTMVAPDEIDLTDGEEATVTEVLARLGGKDDLFCSGHTLVRLLRTHEGRLLLDPMPTGKNASFRNWANKAGIHFVKMEGSPKRLVSKYMPTGVARLVLSRGEWSDVRRMTGVSTVPVVRPDGVLANGLGYDGVTGLLLDVDPDLRLMEISNPSTDDVLAASATILSLLSAFTFDPDRDADASRANAIGLLLTPHLRRTFPGMLAPLHAVDAPERGSGKTLLGGDLPGAFGGGGRSLLTFTGNEAETRKRLTTEMMSGGTGVLCFDNVAPGTTFTSPFLAAALTSPTYGDRLLGGNTQLVVTQNRTFTVTGNRLRLGPDEAARAVLIALKPETSRPDQRSFTVRLDDHREVARIRPMVVEALLTCLLGWVQAGCPGPAEPPVMRQFTEWGTRIGGLLEFMGIKGHLRNAEVLVAEDDTTVRMGVLLDLLWEEFGSGSWTSAMAAGAIEKRPELDPELPSRLQQVLVRDMGVNGLTPRSRHTVAIRIGYVARGHAGTFYDGLRVEKVGFAHGHVTQWCLREEYEGAHEEAGGDGGRGEVA